jgi:hypothetical protein
MSRPDLTNIASASSHVLPQNIVLATSTQMFKESLTKFYLSQAQYCYPLYRAN